MNLTKKQKKQIYSCLILAMTGDTLSFCNNLKLLNIEYNKTNEQKKTDLYNQLYAYNQFNLQSWAHSMYSIWLYFIPPFSISSKTISRKETELNMYKIPIYIRHPKFRLLDSSKYKYKYLNSYKIIKIHKSKLNSYINRIYSNSNYKKNMITIAKKKRIINPSDEFILIGITIGLIYTNISDFKQRDINITTIIGNTHSHPYSYMAIILLSTLITNLYKTQNIIQTLLNTNNYLQTTLNISNKTEQLFCNEFNKFVKKTVINNDTVKYHRQKYKKLNALTTILIAINSYLKYGNNWEMLIYISGMKHQTSPATCAIAASFYGLVRGFKGVPKVQYQNIENGDKVAKNFFQGGKYKNLPFV